MKEGEERGGEEYLDLREGRGIDVAPVGCEEAKREGGRRSMSGVVGEGSGGAEERYRA